MKCLDFYDKPYVRKYVATEATLITWRTGFPQSYGSERRGIRDPLTKRYCQKSLHAYAVGRLRAIHLASGEGRIDDEEGPGGGGMEPKFIRTKIGNNPCSGYRIMLPFSTRPNPLLHMGENNGHQLNVLAHSL